MKKAGTEASASVRSWMLIKTELIVLRCQGVGFSRNIFMSAKGFTCKLIGVVDL